MKKNKKLSIIIALVILLAIVGMAIFITTKYSNGVEFTQLSERGFRQMMGYVIKEKQNLIIIDGGTEQDSENLKKYVDKYNNGTIDYWFITHAHDDHIGAMVSLLEQDKVKIKNIVCSLNNLEWYQQYDSSRADIIERLYKVLEIKNDINIKHVNLKEQFEIGTIEIEILGIKNPEIIENSGNNQSMVFKVHVNDKSILFLGDLGEEASQKLIESNGENLKSYAVQMSHHGQAGVNEEVYKLIKPQVCFWPTPDWLWDNNLDNQGYNTGMWKTLETRQWVENLNVKTNYIAKDGDVTIRIW